MTAAELARCADELGLDVVGAAPPRRTRRPRRTSASGGSAGSSPTCASRWRSPRSRAIPRRCSTGARTVVSAALCYWAPGPEPSPGEGRLPRYAWRDHYAVLRERLDAAGRTARRRVPRARRREPARRPGGGRPRAGVGFYGKNTMLITREHGSWVVLGTLVTDVEIESTPPLDLDCGRCTLCIDACPTGALDEPGVLDATRCLSYWTQAPAAIPDELPGGARRLGVRLRHLPGRLPVEPRHREAAGPTRRCRRTAEPVVSLARLARGAATRSSCARYERLYVPRNDPRWLRRNALVALGNGGGPDHAPAVEPYLAEDEVLSDVAAWALERIGGERA